MSTFFLTAIVRSIFIMGRLTGLGQSVQISADTLELSSGHLDGSSVVSLGNGQVLLVNVHKLDIILAQTVGLSALEHQVNGIGGVLRLEGENIFILGGTQNLGQGAKVDAESDVAVAAVWGEALCAEKHGDQGNMGVVHGLEGDTRVITVEVAVLNQVLDGVDDLMERVLTMDPSMNGNIPLHHLRASADWLARGGLPTLFSMC